MSNLVKRLYRAFQPYIRVSPSFTLSKKSIQMEKANHTDSSLEEYCETLNCSPENLRGDLILDVGSGYRELFSKEAEKYDIKVVSMSPAYSQWRARKRLVGWLKKDPKWQKRSVAARSQNLPFKDRTFDKVIARYSFSLFVNDPHEQFASVQEMVRVLKENGLIFIWPTFLSSPTEIISEKGLRFVREKGREAYTEQVGTRKVLIIGKEEAITKWIEKRLSQYKLNSS